MPANLNALIRYKTINSCLSGGRRKWSIVELMEACTEALADSRGSYNTLSERTLRDDIRVMRSNILGFNAPIKQQKGLYFYSDPHYSIIGISLTDSNIILQVIRFLNEIKSKINHPELEIILKRLSDLHLEKSLEDMPVQESSSTQELSEDRLPSINKMKRLQDFSKKSRLGEPAAMPESKVGVSFGREKITWGELLNLISD